MNTKKIILILLCVYGFTSILKAQPPKYDDLIILYADGKYVKLVDECLKYNGKDATTKDAFPYLMLSKGYYGISQQGDKSEEFKNAFKMSVNALSRFIKKDKDGSVAAENNEFIEKLKSDAAEVLLNEYDTEDYRKVTSSASSYLKASKDNIGARFLDAASKYMQKDRSSANFIWKEFEKPFLDMKSLDTDSPADIRVYKAGILATAECFIQSKQLERARAILDKGKELIQEQEFAKQCDALL